MLISQKLTLTAASHLNLRCHFIDFFLNTQQIQLVLFVIESFMIEQTFARVV